MVATCVEYCEIDAVAGALNLITTFKDGNRCVHCKFLSSGGDNEILNET